MSFVSTLSAEDANSYVDVAAADSYFLTRINSGWWTALTLVQKQAFLVTATLALETWVEFRGIPDVETQSLHFPATGEDCKGKALPDGSIPTQLLHAVCEQASYYNGLDATELPPALLQGLSSASVGSLSVSFNRMNIAGRIGETAKGLITCIGHLRPGATSGGSGSFLIRRI